MRVQYGVYRWYTLDGFARWSGNDLWYIDGMTLMGNRPQTQLDNVDEIQIMKEPDGVLCGGAGASMGGIVIRKRPQATRTADLLCRDVNAAFRRFIYYNFLIPLGGGNYDQAVKADANVAEVDGDGDLDHGFHALAVHSYFVSRSTAPSSIPGSRLMCSQRSATGSKTKRTANALCA